MRVQAHPVQLVERVALNRHQLVHPRADPTHAAPTTPFADTVHHAMTNTGARSRAHLVAMALGDGRVLG